MTMVMVMVGDDDDGDGEFISLRTNSTSKPTTRSITA